VSRESLDAPEDVSKQALRQAAFGMLEDEVPRMPRGSPQLRITGVRGDRVRKSWSDWRMHSLEDVLNQAISEIIVVADARKQHRLDIERQQQEWAEAERRRVEIEQHRRAEEQRLEDLESNAEQWTKNRRPQS
jgi:sigma54-dependent transcription regulator